jgi:hypothetical protein
MSSADPLQSRAISHSQSDHTEADVVGVVIFIWCTSDERHLQM